MSHIKQRIESERLIAIIRLPAGTVVDKIIEAIVRGGISIIEFTLTSSDSLGFISHFKKEYPQCIFGAGTALRAGDVNRSVDAGAEFIVSPIYSREVITESNRLGVPIISGGLTPTEIYNAYNDGADYVKPFPLAGLGVEYIKAIRGPLPDVPLIPTNGVTIDNIADFINAGVKAVGLGSVLVSLNDVQEQRYIDIEKRTEKVVNIINNRKL